MRPIPADWWLRHVTARSSLWNMDTGEPSKPLEAAGVRTGAFSPDGKTIATASVDLTARIWDVDTGQERRLFIGHTGSVSSAAFSPDGKRLLTASWDQTARIWDAETGQELRRLTGHTSYVYDAAFSPDGERIVTASMDSTARIWDTATGQELVRLIGHAGPVSSAVFSPDGERIVTAVWTPLPASGTRPRGGSSPAQRPHKLCLRCGLQP